MFEKIIDAYCKLPTILPRLLKSCACQTSKRFGKIISMRVKISFFAYCNNRLSEIAFFAAPQSVAK